ncbi:MAG: hypothetical protein MUC29_02635 [Pyrinomonadaceae bacterium]|jgi:hypothetical protein|nr:hypothetical protein [Pyrinomonadaceae bacterium]
MKRTIRERILNPKPNSKVAAAVEFGIDLTLNIKTFELTPEQRILNNFQCAEQFEKFTEAMKKSRNERKVK